MIGHRGERNVMVYHCAILLLNVPPPSQISQSLLWAHVAMAGVGCCDGSFYCQLGRVTACPDAWPNIQGVSAREGIFGGD